MNSYHLIIALKIFIVVYLCIQQTCYGGLFSTKKRSWTTSPEPVGMPALATPVITTGQWNHEISTYGETKGFLANHMDINLIDDGLIHSLTHAEYTKHVYMSFWMDSKVTVGSLELLMIEKKSNSNSITLTKGVATIRVPAVQTKRQECQKKKKWHGRTKTNCWDVYEPRGLYQNEIEFIARHLESAFRNSPEFQPLLTASSEL